MAAAGFYKGYEYLVLSRESVDKIDGAAPAEEFFALSRVMDDALSVSLGEIIDGSVDEDALADGAVTEDKIGTDAITVNKIADNAVSADKLAVDVLQKVTVNITATELRNLNGTPKQIIAAPGSNKAILVESWTAKMTFVANAYDSVGAGEDLVLRYTDGSGTILAQLETVGFLDQTSSQTRIGKATTDDGSAALIELTPTANAAVMAHILSGEIAAADLDANGDSTLAVTAYYRILDV